MSRGNGSYPRTARRAAAAALAVSAIACFGITTGAVNVHAAAALTPLPLDVIPGLSALAPTSATDPNTPVEIDIALQDSNPSGEAAYMAGLYTPGSANYRQFLTPAQFATQFGAPSADLNAALTFATSQGLSVVRTSTANDLIVLSGNVAQAEATFGVTIDNYTWHQQNFWANTAAPSVPSGLGIVGVVGLNSAQVSHLNQTMCEGVAPAQDCVGLTTPEDLWSAYDQPAINQGQGQKMAIFGEGAWGGPISDLRLFEADPDQSTTCGGSGQPACADALPKTPVRVVEVDGAGGTYSDTAGDGEWDLDMQASTGMAPQVQELDLYFGTSLSDADTLNVANDWANDPNAPLQASASYGECEYDPGASSLPADQFAAGQAYTVSYEQTMQQAFTEGRTLFSSSGDDGASCPVLPVDTNGGASQAFPDVNYPCASPEVVCVGGTVLNTTGATPNARHDETSWTYTGGGSSLIFPQPAWQTGAPPVTFLCPYNDLGQPNTTQVNCRGVPDVAAQSGDTVPFIEVLNGYGIYSGGSPTGNGGTSLSSPLSLGMWTRIQAASSTGTGNAAPALYKAGAATTGSVSSDFYDIGNPGASPASPPTSNQGAYFTSAPGWDYLSGLGVMDVTNLAKGIDGGTAPVDNVASPNTGAVTYIDGTTYQPIQAAAPVDPACVPLFTGNPDGSLSYPLNPTGMDYPYFDVIQGDMHNTATTLTTILTIKDMEEYTSQSPPAPSTVEQYGMLWNYAGTTYYTEATVAATGDTFGYGTFSGNTYNAGTGTNVVGAIVDGTNGTITITIPLSYVGSPSSGSVLTSPNASVQAWAGTPPPAETAAGYTADTAGPGYSYTLNEICAATGMPGSSGGTGPGTGLPEVPLAPLLPLTGVALGGAVVYRRRRHTSS